MSEPLRLLLVEDSIPDATLIEARLELHFGAAYQLRVERVESREAFLAAMKKPLLDLVLADYNVPSFDGTETLRLARELRPELPFIFVTGALGEERAVELLKLGATDYVLKDRLERLGSSIERALRETKEKVALRSAQDALNESERMLSTLMSNMPGMAFRCRPEPPWHFTYVSPAAAELTGYSAEELLNSEEQSSVTWASLVHPEDYKSLVDSSAALRSGTQRTERYRIVTRDGQERWVWDRAVGIYDTAGKLVWLEGFVTDVTQQVRAELETAKRVDFEQQLIGIVSHDLRNPLNVISLAAQTALFHDDLDARVVRSLVKIRTACDRSTRLIRDLLDFTQARLGTGIDIQRRSVDLRELLGQVVDEAETTHPGRRVRVVHDGATDGHWDPDRLAQALVNLVVNAFKHGAPDEIVTIRTTATSPQEMLIEVHNAGNPIPDDLRGRLFLPMQRGSSASDRTTRSVGLGLYIVHSIVRAHDGRIDVESSAETGTTFRIRLPTQGIQPSTQNRNTPV